MSEQSPMLTENQTVKVFMGGDIFSTTGMNTVLARIPSLLTEYAPDFVIFNGENVSGGNGLLQADAEKLFACGIDVLTGGNHIFEKREAYPFLDMELRVLRPQNYPTGAEELFPQTPKTPGRGFGVYTKNGVSIAVLNVQGRDSLMPLDCPFRAADSAAKEAAAQNALLFVDFHAESNREKEALALFLDGRAAAVCGTHTHVQTADERILPKGTAYITDLGMCGAVSSVIGTKTEIAVKRNLTQILYRMEDAEEEEAINGVLITVDCATKTALSIERVVV